MLCRHSLKLSVLANIFLLSVLPVQAQQVILTPAGTAIQTFPGSTSISTSPAPSSQTSDMLSGLTNPNASSELPIWMTDSSAGLLTGTSISAGALRGENAPRVSASPAEIAEVEARYAAILQQVTPQIQQLKSAGVPIPEPAVSIPNVSPTTVSTTSAVAVQASQNPTADFAPTRSAPRNTVPEQLNQGVINSPLSDSRIFPGMR